MKAIGLLGERVGDAVMCSVAARQFKTQFPDAHLTFALSKHFGHVIDLFRGLPYIDDFHVWDSSGQWPNAQDEAFLNVKGFDVVFDAYPQHTRHEWYNHFHYVEETCLMLGLDRPKNLQCELGYKPKHINGLEKTITTSLFASGNQPYKTLNPDKMATLLSGLNKLGYNILQVGSTDLPIDGAKNLTSDIYTAIDHINSAKLHLTIDTAFSWIASAYQRPLVGLYGVNYADMPLSRVISHNPVNPNATYINEIRVDNIDIDRIIDDVKQYL